MSLHLLCRFCNAPHQKTELDHNKHWSNSDDVDDDDNDDDDDYNNKSE